MSTTGAVVSSIWAKASGRYATIVIGLWLLTAAVSLVWTPYSLLDTDGFTRGPRIRRASVGQMVPERMC